MRRKEKIERLKRFFAEKAKDLKIAKDTSRYKVTTPPLLLEPLEGVRVPEMIRPVRKLSGDELMFKIHAITYSIFHYGSDEYARHYRQCTPKSVLNLIKGRFYDDKHILIIDIIYAMSGFSDDTTLVIDNDNIYISYNGDAYGVVNKRLQLPLIESCEVVHDPIEVLSRRGRYVPAAKQDALFRAIVRTYPKDRHLHDWFWHYTSLYSSREVDALIACIPVNRRPYNITAAVKKSSGCPLHALKKRIVPRHCGEDQFREGFKDFVNGKTAVTVDSVIHRFKELNKKGAFQW